MVWGVREKGFQGLGLGGISRIRFGVLFVRFVERWGVSEIGFRRFVLGIAERDKECLREVWHDLDVMAAFVTLCFMFFVIESKMFGLRKSEQPLSP